MNVYVLNNPGKCRSRAQANTYGARKHEPVMTKVVSVCLIIGANNLFESFYAVASRLKRQTLKRWNQGSNPLAAVS